MAKAGEIKSRNLSGRNSPDRLTFADQTLLGEWLRKQSEVSIAAFWQIISGFVGWVIAQAAAARRT